jgi:oxygen-independent coproporphyrinogen-3 oxidase
MTAEATVSLYIHIPFCIRKCDYCDFYSEPMPNLGVQELLVKNILLQTEYMLEQTGRPDIVSLYIGGGTPSVLDITQMDILLAGIFRHTGAALGEATVEVNPETVSADLIYLFSDYGITRLSVGVQSFSDTVLSAIGRRCSSRSILRALESLYRLWTGALSLDLMSALPGQSADEARSDVERVIDFHPEHISRYELTLEKEVPLAQRRSELCVSRMSDDLQQHSDLSIEELLLSAGYEHYEISNYALPGRESRHNMRYWELKPYIGCGPSAVSTVAADTNRAKRIENVRSVRIYNNNVRESPSEYILTAKEFLLEHLMMGFRTEKGVSRGRINSIFDIDINDLLTLLPSRWADELIYREDAISLKPEGRAFLDSFLEEVFLAADTLSVPEAYSWQQF